MSENDTPKLKQLEVIDVVVGQQPTPIKWDDMTGAIQHLDTNEHIKFLERAEELLRTVGYKSHVG